MHQAGSTDEGSLNATIGYVSSQEAGPADRLRRPAEGALQGRNVVERYFNKLKQWRGIAVRSEKLLGSYRAFTLAAMLV